MFGTKRKAVSIQTLIGSDTRIEGDLSFASGCHIDGVVNGNVSNRDSDAEAYLSISENGRVEGNVSVPRLGLSGTVEGDVFVAERAEFGPTARVNGNVHYNLIEIAAGAEINGQLIHEVPAAAVSPKKAPADHQATDVMTKADLQAVAKSS